MCYESVGPHFPQTVACTMRTHYSHLLRDGIIVFAFATPIRVATQMKRKKTEQSRTTPNQIINKCMHLLHLAS
ncbi:hypothetical protein Mapa_012403 [Marchantia paleacea]|nr:hypothetical protein Mapa_012403 [Marchantia paleacea]